jgi:transcriptional regulator with XRE-family HTH domain
MCRPLHERLRTARERQGLSLADVARASGVRETNLQLIDSNAFEDLPTGLYGRNAVRGYAAAVGVPIDEALAEVHDRLREVEDPIDGLARVRGLERPRQPRPIDVAPAVEHPVGGGLVWRKPVAALVDIAILVAIDAAVVYLTAFAAGVPAGEAMRFAAPALFFLFALIATAYYVLLGGVRQATLGSRLVNAPPALHAAAGADSQAVVHRSLGYVVDQASSLGSWVVTMEHARHLARVLREKGVDVRAAAGRSLSFRS